MPSETVVAIGTTRGPKLRAVERALRTVQERLPAFVVGELRLEARSVPSGAPEMPRTTAEMMLGAKNRAEAALETLLAEGRHPALGIGLEGGVLVEGECTLLESWSYVTNGDRGAYGSSGCIPLPAPLARAVLEAGELLGSAADRHFRRREVASHEGTFGVLTCDLVTREEAFVRSLLHALAPFYNESAYSEGNEV